MFRNRKTAAIVVAVAAVVLAVTFTVGRSLASPSKGSAKNATTTSDENPSNADNGSGSLVSTGGRNSGGSNSSGASGSGQSASGGNGSSTTTPPTTTPPGGGGRPPFRFPIDQVGNLGLDKNPGTPPTTTPPNHNPIDCLHKLSTHCP